MTAYFVTGAGTDIGKTYVACGLIRAWRADGYWCDALKPVVTGFDDAAPEGSDPAQLIAALGREPTPKMIEHVAPVRFKAPLAPPQAARAERRNISMLTLQMECQGRISRMARDLLLIEGAGGVMSPIAEDATVLDLIQRLDIPVIFVAGTYLGAVSHALTGLDVLETRGVEIAGIVVSESEHSVGLSETCEMLERHGIKRRVRRAARGGTEWAQSLARVLASRGT